MGFSYFFSSFSFLFWSYKIFIFFHVISLYISIIFHFILIYSNLFYSIPCYSIFYYSFLFFFIFFSYFLLFYYSCCISYLLFYYILGYLLVTSIVGLYSIPVINKILPKPRYVMGLVRSDSQRYSLNLLSDQKYGRYRRFLAFTVLDSNTIFHCFSVEKVCK